MSDPSSACNNDYCVCNPEFSPDQACPFEFFSKVDYDVPNFNRTVSVKRLTMLCVEDKDSSKEYYPNSTFVIDDNGYGIIRLELISNLNASMVVSICDDYLGKPCVDAAPPCNSIVVSESPTLAPTLSPVSSPMPTKSSSSPAATQTGALVPLLLVWLVMAFSRKY